MEMEVCYSLDSLKFERYYNVGPHNSACLHIAI